MKNSNEFEVPERFTRKLEALLCEHGSYNLIAIQKWQFGQSARYPDKFYLNLLDVS